MGLDLEYAEGQTPLDEYEKEGLIIRSITTRGELDELEQLGVEQAIEFYLNKRFAIQRVLNQDFIKGLHYRMFREIWEWAGNFRVTNKNIGVDKYEISIEIKNLIDDALFWVEGNIFGEDEIAVRVSHRLVKIHPFANGNGRHSRLIADIIISNCFGGTLFTWGSKNLVRQGEARSAYLGALKAADDNDYKPLIDFSRM